LGARIPEGLNSRQRSSPRRCDLPRTEFAFAPVVGELVEEQPPHDARVEREQRRLDRLGQVDQREHGTVEVREVGAEPLTLGLAEGLDRILHGRTRVAARPAGTTVGACITCQTCRSPGDAPVGPSIKCQPRGPGALPAT
jgi:hypothetical protein